MRGFFFLIGVVAVLGFAFYWWQPEGQLVANLPSGTGASMSAPASITSSNALGAPQIVAFAPSDDRRDIPLDQQVQITFSKPMDRAAVESAIHANFPYYLHWDSDTVLRLEPVSLRPNEQYQYFVSTLATDTQGTAIPESLHVRFMTVQEQRSSSVAMAAESSSSALSSLTPVPPPAEQAQSSFRQPAQPVRAQATPHVVPTSKPPVVDGIVLEELSPLEDVPRYLVSITASDPEGAPLSFQWNVSCGRLAGKQDGRTIEWRTDSMGCRSAVLSVDVSDAVGASTTYVQRAF